MAAIGTIIAIFTCYAAYVVMTVSCCVVLNPQLNNVLHFWHYSCAFSYCLFLALQLNSSCVLSPSSSQLFVNSQNHPWGWSRLRLRVWFVRFCQTFIALLIVIIIRWLRSYQWSVQHKLQSPMQMTLMIPQFRVSAQNMAIVFPFSSRFFSFCPFCFCGVIPGYSIFYYA